MSRSQFENLIEMGIDVSPYISPDGEWIDMGVWIWEIKTMYPNRSFSVISLKRVDDFPGLYNVIPLVMQSQ